MKKPIAIEDLQKWHPILKELGLVNDRKRTEEELIYGKPRTASKIRLLKRYYASLNEYYRNKMSKYKFEVKYSVNDNGYIATVPEFPGLSAFGETEKEALEQGKVALELFIEETALKNR